VTLRRATRAGLALLLLLALPFGASAAGLTGATMRGKRIYTEGKGRGKITAYLPGAGIRAPGSGFPCVNCHLAGGTGQSEGGVRSADIAWFTLTKEYGGRRPSGRAHPPYTDETFRTAVTGGVDPAGNVLASAHPRYGMDREDLDDLLAYAGAVLLEEGLRRSGKGVTREKLVGAVGNVWKLQTGVTPPLTYNANRRTGAPGAAIIRMDPGTGRLVTVLEWREPR